MKCYLQTQAEKQGFDGASYMRGWYDALAVDENQSIVFDTKIKIKPLNCDGIIVGIYMSRTYGIEYQIQYYMNGKQERNYFFADEIEESKLNS